MEKVYDQEKVRKGIDSMIAACNDCGMNLLEVYKASQALMASAESLMIENTDDAHAMREALEKA